MSGTPTFSAAPRIVNDCIRERGTDVTNNVVSQPSKSTASFEAQPNRSTRNRRLWRFTTLRPRLLVAFMLIVLLTVVPITIGSVYTTRVLGEERVLNQLQSVAEVKQSTIDTWLTSLQTTLAGMLQEPSLSTLTQESARGASDPAQASTLLEHLQHIQRTTAVFEEIFLMDPEGRVFVSTDEDQIGKIFINELYFTEGLRRPTNSAPFYSPSLQRLSLVAARPLVNQEGETYAVIAGRASPDFLSRIMQDKSGLGETGETYLVSANHGLLTSAKGFVVTENEQIYVRDEGVGEVLDERQSLGGLFRDFRDVPVAGYYNWYPRLQVVVVAEQDRAEAFVSINQILLIIMAVTIFAVAAAIVASIFVSNRITRPIEALGNAATQIESEEFSLEQLNLGAVERRTDEIGRFARVFTRMATQVYAREQELRRQVEELKIVIDRQKQEEEVAQLTDSEFFRDLAEKASEIRRRRRR